MRLGTFLAITFAVFAFARAFSKEEDEEEDVDFCYEKENCGPDSERWGGECKTGHHQSPIDLVPVSGSADPRTFVSLTFNDMYKSDEFFVLNNGHTVQVNFRSDLSSSALMSGYGFDRPYKFAQIHFHWGLNDSTGSEHTVQGKHYAMEVHLVHYDSKYGSFQEAAASGDHKGLAVLGIFLEPGLESDINESFDTICDHLPMDFGEAVKVAKPLDLHWLFPEETESVSFFRYFGSLTTPNCTESVEWTVLQKPLKVKPSEIDRFRHVLGHDAKPMGLNYRPVQPLGDREVEYLYTATGGVQALQSHNLLMSFFALPVLLGLIQAKL